MRLAWIALLLVPFARAALAEDDRAGRVREALERELQEMVKLPSASVEIIFDGIGATRYTLLEASFALDDKPIPFAAGNKVLYKGEVAPGRHILTATIVCEAPAVPSGMVKYKVPGKFIFNAQRGVFMRVRARIAVDDGAEASKRLQLVGSAQTDLRAKLEDGVLPAAEPPLDPNDKGAIRYGKKVAPEPDAEEEARLMRRLRKKASSAAKVAATSSDPAPIHPVSLKQPGDRRRAHRKSAAAAVAAKEEAVEAPSTQVGESAAAPIATEPVESADAGMAERSSEDAGFAPAPLAAAVTPPRTLPPVPPPPAKETVGARGMAMVGAALGFCALLVFLFARRRD